MAASWVLSDLGSGLQPSRVVSGEVAIDLVERAWFEVRMAPPTSDFATATWGPADCTAVDTGTEVVFTHTGEGSTVTLTLSERAGGDALMIVPEVELAGAHLASYAFDSIDVSVAIDCTGGGWRLRWPELTGEVVPDASVTTERELSYPSFCALSGGLHGHPFAFAYQAAGGLWFGAVTGQMRGRYLKRSSAAGVLTLRMRLIPPDNRSVTSWAAPYGVELAPMVGTFYDADVRYRERAKAEGLASMATPLRDVISEGVEGTDVFIAHLNGSEVDAAQELRDVEDALDILGVEPSRVAVQHYRWHALPIGDTWPDTQVAPRAGATSLVSDLTSLGVRVIPYTIQHLAHETAPNYAAQGWADEIVRTPSQGIHYRQVPGYSTVPNGLHALLDFVSPTVRSERQTWWLNALRSAFGGSARGSYFDAHGAFWAMANYRAGLGAGNRGPGAPALAEAWRAHLEESRALWHGDDPQSLIVTEHANDITIGSSDLVSDQGFSYFLPEMDRLALSVTPTLFSEFGRFISFEGFASLVERTVFGHTGWPWLESWRWHDGWMASITLNQGINDVRPDASSSRRASWDEYMAPTWEFWRRMRVGLAGAARRFHIGRRLRPLPDGQEEDLIAHGWRYEILVDPHSGQVSYGFTGMKKVHSSVWLDPPTGAIGVFLSNWHPRESGEQRVAITNATHPELPAGRLRIVETDANTGRERVLDHFERDDGWHQTMRLSPRDVRHLRIEPAPHAAPRQVVGAWSTTQAI